VTAVPSAVTPGAGAPAGTQPTARRRRAGGDSADRLQREPERFGERGCDEQGTGEPADEHVTPGQPGRDRPRPRRPDEGDDDQRRPETEPVGGERRDP